MSDAPKRKVGRPLAITPEVEAVIVEAVRRGLPWVAAAQAAGVSHDIIQRYRSRGEDDLAAGHESRFASFASAVARARAEGLQALHDLVLRGAMGDVETVTETVRHPDGRETTRTIQRPVRGSRDWRASAWLAERRFREDYGQRQVVDVTSGGLSVDELLRRAIEIQDGVAAQRKDDGE